MLRQRKPFRWSTSRRPWRSSNIDQTQVAAKRVMTGEKCVELTQQTMHYSFKTSHRQCEVVVGAQEERWSNEHPHQVNYILTDEVGSN